MSSLLIAKAVRNATAKGQARIALLVMADAAGEDGIVTLTRREIAKRCNFSEAAAGRAIQTLLALKLLDKSESGALELKPSLSPLADCPDSHPMDDPPAEHYQTTPDIKPDPAPSAETMQMLDATSLKPDFVKASRVDELRSALGIELDPLKPFYWKSPGHEAELDQLLEVLGSKSKPMQFDDLLDMVKRRNITAPNILRFTVLAEIIASSVAR